MPSLFSRWRKAPHPPLNQPAAGRPELRPSVRPRVIFQRVHVSPEQLGRIVISEQAHRQRFAEKASTLRIAAKDFRRRGIEDEPDSLLATP